VLVICCGNLELVTEKLALYRIPFTGVMKANMVLGEILRLLAIITRRDESMIENEAMKIKNYRSVKLIKQKAAGVPPD